MLWLKVIVVTAILPCALSAQQGPHLDLQLPLLRTLKCESRPQSLSFSPNGKTLAVALGRDILFFDLKTGNEHHRWAYGEGIVHQISHTFNGDLIAVSSGAANSVVLRETATGKQVGLLELGNQGMNCWAIPAGRGPIATATGTDVTLWGIARLKPVWRKSYRNPAVKMQERPYALSLSHDCEMLALSTDRGSVSLLNVVDGVTVAEVRQRQLDCPTPWGFTFSPARDDLAISYRERAASVLWTSFTLNIRHDLEWPKKPMREGFPGAYDCAFSADGNTLFVLCQDGVIRAYETVTGAIRMTKPDGGHALKVSPCGRWLASCHEASVEVYDLHGITFAVNSPSSLSLEQLWSSLQDKNGTSAFQAMLMLKRSNDMACKLLAKHLHAVFLPDPKAMSKLVADLTDESFDVRNKASESIRSIGPAAVPSLQHHLRTTASPEVRKQVSVILTYLTRRDHPERMQYVRAVELLEGMGTDESSKILTNLSSGSRGIVETDAAVAACQRIKARK